MQAGKFLNRQNLKKLSRKVRSWKQVENDTKTVENMLKIKFRPRNKKELLYSKLTGMLLNSKTNHKKIQRIKIKYQLFTKIRRINPNPPLG